METVCYNLVNFGLRNARGNPSVRTEWRDYGTQQPFGKSDHETGRICDLGHYHHGCPHPTSPRTATFVRDVRSNDTRPLADGTGHFHNITHGRTWNPVIPLYNAGKSTGFFGLIFCFPGRLRCSCSLCKRATQYGHASLCQRRCLCGGPCVCDTCSVYL